MSAPLQAEVSAVRRFNRFYTREIGALRKNFLETPWSLGEMRVLFEIANGTNLTASDVARALDLDPAYVSRMLQKFGKDGLVTRKRCDADGRRSFLELSAKGRKQFATANSRQVEQTTCMLARLKPVERQELIGAMNAIVRLLEQG